MPETPKSPDGPARARRPYVAPRVRAYGNIREITLSQAPVITNRKDNGKANSGNDKTDTH